MLIEGVVKGKGMIFHVLGYAVDFVLGLVDFDLRVGARDRVDFSALFFLLEDGSLPDTHCQLHLIHSYLEIRA